MKKILLFLFAVTLSLTAFSQDLQKPVKSLFFEFGGNGGLFSVNYDRRFSKANDGLGWRAGIGLGAVPTHILFGVTPTLPIGLNYLLGKGSHHLEAGIGVTIGTEDFSPSGDRISSTYFVPSLGYRYQRPKGFSCRLVVSPFIGAKTEISGGLSFGTSF